MANVVVSGASRGIGFELARQHLAAGDRVFALVRNPDGSGELNALAAGSDGMLTVHEMDVADDRSVLAAAAATGSERVDLLYNVAGITGKTEPMLEPGSMDTFDEAIEIMLKGPLRVLQSFLPRLGEGSRVINFSSQLAAKFWPYGGYYPYVAAKAGLNRLMRSVAIDLKDRGIIIGLIHPGYVQTDMGGPEADITPQDSASQIMKLAAWWPLDKSGDFYKWNGEEHSW